MDDPGGLDASVRRLKGIFEDTSYYAAAEVSMDEQWRGFILPRIGSVDFTRTLELAPGHGRNTLKLKDHAEDLHVVDVNASCIDACRRRFAEYSGRCRFHFHVNDGKTLPVPDQTITFFYSWDSMVHFDGPLLRVYLEEIGRVLVPGGHAFIHHSNYGTRARGATFEANPSLRGNVSADEVREWCDGIGFQVLSHEDLDWDGVEALDAVALIRR